MTCSVVDNAKHHRVAVASQERAAGVLEVRRQALLRPVAPHEVRSHADDTRARIGELARAEGPGDGLLEGDGDSVGRSHHGGPEAGCESLDTPRSAAAFIRGSTLRAAWALIFGKTETVEFAATGRPAPTCNPHDLARNPGGSSSGSAAAVADFHVPLALGTQTGGSMVRPASFCGVYAMKPTWNLVSREGVKTCSISLDPVGWFARSAADLALLHDVFEPEPDRRSAPAPFALAGARIGLCRSPVWPAASLDTRHATERAASLLREAGADVSDLDLPRPFDDLVDLQRIVMRAEGQGAFLAEYRTFGTALTESFREQVENVDRTTRAQLLHAYDTASACRSVFDRIAAPFDAVLTPSTVGVAPEGLAATGAMTFNAMWSLLHVPAINVPGLQGSNGMPIGLTLTGPRFSDRHLLAVAASLGALLARERA